MFAEPLSVSLVSQFSVSKPKQIPEGYYRSKLFIASASTNPLVSAAGPLFSLLERLSISPTLPPVNQIRDNIEHELEAFQSRLTSQQYAEEFIIIARYLLSATIDELLGKNYIRLYGKPAEFKAFTPLSDDQVEPQRRFFDIVHYLKERAVQYLDLLELVYYCLIAGFEGEQHLAPNGRQVLDELIEELYQLIQQHRVYQPYQLFPEQARAQTFPVKPHKPLVIRALLTAGLLTTVYLASHVWLEYKAKTVLRNHIVFTPMDS